MKTRAMTITLNNSFSWNDLSMRAFDLSCHFTLISALGYLYLNAYHYIFRRVPFIILGKGTGTPFRRK